MPSRSWPTNCDRVLLDECVPRKLKNNFIGYECQTVPEVGLAGKKNGELLARAVEAGFEVFVTVDRGIEYEQNLVSYEIAVIVMRARSRCAQDRAGLPICYHLYPKF